MLASRLGAFGAGLAYGDLPEEVRAKARAILVHGLAMALAAYATPTARIARAVARADGARTPGSTLLVDGDCLSTSAAAFANGAMLHARTQEDALGPIHFGPVVLPLALALAEQTGASGRDLIAAIVAAYEVGAAVAEGTVDESTARGFRATPLYGGFAAATVAGRLLGLSEAEHATALGYAAAFAFGTLETARAKTMEWRYQAGVAAQHGLLAARLAQQGASAAPEAFEGPFGFYRTFVGRLPEGQAPEEHLGRRYRTLDVILKPFPVCVFSQAPITALCDILAEADLPATDIASLEVELHDYDANYPGMAFTGPFTSTGQAGASLFFVLGLAALERDVRLAGLKRAGDPEIARIISNTRLHARPERRTLTCRLQLTTADGRTFEREVDAGSRYSRPPLAAERAFVRQLYPEMPLPPAQLDAALDALERLDEAPSVTELMSLLVRERETP